MSLGKKVQKSVQIERIDLISYYDIGGQNKIYKGKMTQVNLASGQKVTKDVILKTAQIDKNSKFSSYLESENDIIIQLSDVAGVCKSYGIQQVYNHFNCQDEQHLVLEFCQYGSLFNLSAFTKPFDEPTAFVVFRQICQALQQVHDQKVLHLDIKESNILINFNRENQFQPECGKIPIEFKLADWGVSVDLKNRNTRSKVSPVFHRGTPRYMPPEQYESKPVEDPFKVEVYSLGIILFRMIFKTFPFSSDQKVALAEQNKPSFLQDFIKSSKNTFKVQPSAELIDLLQNILTPVNHKRFTVNQVLAHKWCSLQINKLTTDEQVQSKTYKSLFQKLQYVNNLTRVKIDMKKILEKKKMKEEQVKLIEPKKDILKQVHDHWLKNQQQPEQLQDRPNGLSSLLPEMIGQIDKNDCFTKSPEIRFKQQPLQFIPLQHIIGSSINKDNIDNDFTLQIFINDIPAQMKQRQNGFQCSIMTPSITNSEEKQSPQIQQRQDQMHALMNGQTNFMAQPSSLYL